MMKLTEGMWAGDLEDLLQPVISVDEYESKIDNEETVVVVFFINDKDAAEDLNRFIQKSPSPIVDSEVSPAPDQKGYYLVFVELSNNDRFYKNLTNILDEVGQLSRITNWKVKIRGLNKIVDIDERLVRRVIAWHRIGDRLKALKELLEQLHTAT